MALKTKIKLWLIGISISLVLIAYVLLNMEFVQKKIFNIRADITGSETTISFYSQIDATKVASYSDKDMRYETKPSGAISVWLGSKSNKVESNMLYIIEDTK